MIQFGKTGKVHWTVSVGEHDERSFTAFVEHLLGGFTQIAQAGDVTLTIACNGQIPTAPRRKQLQEVGKFLSQKGIQLPHAYVTNSRAGMGIMTALRWVIKPDYPERAFVHPLRGLEWLATHAPQVQPEGVLSRIAAESSEYQRLAWAAEARSVGT